MRTSKIGIHKRLADCAQLMGLVGLLLSSPAVADIYPIKGVWVAPNPDFPSRPDEACFTVRHSGIEAVTRKFIAELLIFNDNKQRQRSSGQIGSSWPTVKRTRLTPRRTSSAAFQGSLLSRPKNTIGFAPDFGVRGGRDGHARRALSEP